MDVDKLLEEALQRVMDKVDNRIEFYRIMETHKMTGNLLYRHVPFPNHKTTKRAAIRLKHNY